VIGKFKGKPRLVLTFFATLMGLGLIVYLVPFGEIAKTLNKLEPQRFSLALLIYGISYLLRTLRWKYYYPNTPFGKLFFTTSVNTLLNNLLPARLGEFSIFVLLNRYDKNLKETVKKILKVRLLDGFALLTLFSFAVISVNFNPLWASVIAISVYPTAVLLWNKLPLEQKFPKLKMDGIAFALSVGALFFKLFSVYLVFHFLPLDFLKFTIGFLGGEISTILPIHSLAGLGSYETAFSLALKIFTGESFKKGFEVGFLSHSFLLGGSLLLGLLSLPFLVRGKP